jgi:DNA-binding NarL/FixJ family response regulator
MAIRIFVADDHPIARAGLKSLLRGTEINVVDEAATSEAAVKLAAKHNPDAILLDVQMPDNDGLWALGKLKSERSDLPVLMWSAFDHAPLMARAVSLGASGYLLKTATRDELVRAIRAVAAGDTTWTGVELRRVALALARSPFVGDAEALLTQRESEVLKQLAQGATNKEIARTLAMNFKTVKDHVVRIFQKVGATDRTQAALWAVRKKLI